MSTRNLEQLLHPASVAVIGTSPAPGHLGSTLWRHLRQSRFQGAVYAVDPRARRLDGHAVAPRIDALPEAPGLALICTAPDTVAGHIAALGAMGTRAAVVCSTRLDAAQRQAVLDAARPHLLRVLGPGSMGLLVPPIGLNASLAAAETKAGDLAFISQSDALAHAMLDWARTRGIGFSQVVALGDGLDVDAGDLLDHLASDGQTRAILLYLEDVVSPRKFLSAARAAARNKPVIVVRGGAAADPAADRVVGAALARAGMLRVDTLQQMFLAAETLARFRSNRSERLAIVCNGVGAGTLAADAAARVEVALAEPLASTRTALEPLLVRPAAGVWVLSDDAPVAAQLQALQLLHDDPAAPGLLLIHAPNATVSSAQLARALLPLATQPPPRLMGCWLGDSAVSEARRVFQEAAVPHYATPEEAVTAFAMLVTYRRNQAQLIEAPPIASADVPADAAAARALVQQALGSGRTQLDPLQAQALLGAYGIELAPQLQVPLEPYAAASAAERCGYPVALRLVAHDALPGDEALTLRLDLRSAAQVRDAARQLLGRWRRQRRDDPLEAFTVQPMPPLRHARALLVATRIDPVFGPVILFGPGGHSVDDGAEVAVALPPLNPPLARALVQRTPAARLLQAHGDVPAADEAGLLHVLVGVSQLLIDVSALEALQLALLVGPGGAVALDARVSLSVRAPSGAMNFAIRPYPSHLAETVEWAGHRVTLRPIRPEDEAQHLRFLSALDPTDIRMRVFHTRRGIDRSQLARLTQIDYAREMALIAVEPDAEGTEQTLGVVRAVCDPDNVSAEFGIVVRSDLKGRRLGELLMQRIIEYQRAHGTAKLVGTVLEENARMLELARRMGFVEVPSREGGVRAIELALQPPREPAAAAAPAS